LEQQIQVRGVELYVFRLKDVLLVNMHDHGCLFIFFTLKIVFMGFCLKTA